MNDTNPIAALHFRRLIMAKSREERLLMGCSMFDTAKEIVKDAIVNHNPGIAAKKLKEEIFLRFYGMEFNKAEKEKILNAILFL